MSISYWLDKATTASSTSSKNYDFVIVGGGIAGLSSAYWLQQKDPSLKIAIIEKNRVGFGASGRNAGFVTCGSTEHYIKLNEQYGTGKATEIWKFSEMNRHLLAEHVIQDQAAQLDYRQTGSCTVAPSDQHWEKYKTTAKLMRSEGIDVVEVSPDEMNRDYGVTGFVGGIQYNGDGYIHPVKLLNLLRSKLNVDFYEGHETIDITENNGTTSVRTDHGVFNAKHALLTLNAYLPLVVKKMAGLIVPGRGQILVTEPLPDFVKGPCYLTKHLCYFRQLPTGHLLIGGFRNLAADAEATYADTTTPIIQEALLDFVRSHFTLGKEAKVAYQWSGVMAYSPDGQMILGTLPEHKNVHVMSGCSGHGMGLSFHAAKTLVGSVFGEQIPEHLRITRFKF